MASLEKMKPVALDKPFKLSLDFWVAYVLFSLPTLWFTKPWAWDLPIISKVAGVLFFPFATAIVCYCPILFTLAIVRGGSRERKIGVTFLSAVAGVTLFLGIAWIYYGFQPLPHIFAAVSASYAIRFLARSNSRSAS
jgi:hypothetical protein